VRFRRAAKKWQGFRRHSYVRASAIVICSPVSGRFYGFVAGAALWTSRNSTGCRVASHAGQPQGRSDAKPLRLQTAQRPLAGLL
jgi:hypothetical protein